MRVAVYSRVSSEKYSQSKSIGNQNDIVQEFIDEKKWTLHKIYSDKLTGTSYSRNEYDRMLKDGIDKKFDVIISKQLNRMGRNGIALSDLLKYHLKYGIHIVTLDWNNPINTLTGEISHYFEHVSDAAKEARNISDRTKDSLAIKAKRGEYTRGEAPYGYYVDDSKLYVSDDGTPLVVKRIFREFISGKGRENIAKNLTLEGIPTPAAVKEKKNAGNVWHDSTIKLILINPHYTGDLVQSRETRIDILIKKRKKVVNPIIIMDTHESIISKEEFQLVQRLMEERKKVGAASPTKHLFSDKLICADCGSKLWYYANRKGYVCGKHAKLGNTICKSHSIKEEGLVQAVSTDLKEIRNGYAQKKDLMKSLVNTYQKKRGRLEKEMRHINGRIKKVERTQIGLTKKFALDEINKYVYKQTIKELEKEKESLQESIETLQESLEVDQAIEIQESLKKIKEFISFDSITREVINRFIDKIVVEENGDIDIYYNFKME